MLESPVVACLKLSSLLVLSWAEIQFLVVKMAWRLLTVCPDNIPGKVISWESPMAWAFLIGDLQSHSR